MRRSKEAAVGGLLGKARQRAPNHRFTNHQAAVRRIIGIDPGLASTGWGVVDWAGGKIRYVDHGNIETKAGCPRAERLFFIMQSVRSILDTYKPAEAAIENLYFGKNVSSAIPVAESRGVVSVCLAERGLFIHEFTPNAIKRGVAGVSSADKRQVQEMVRIILGLAEIPKPDHAADALGAAICAANSGVIQISETGPYGFRVRTE